MVVEGKKRNKKRGQGNLGGKEKREILGTNFLLLNVGTMIELLCISLPWREAVSWWDHWCPQSQSRRRSDGTAPPPSAPAPQWVGTALLPVFGTSLGSGDWTAVEDWVGCLAGLVGAQTVSSRSPIVFHPPWNEKKLYWTDYDVYLLSESEKAHFVFTHSVKNIFTYFWLTQ